jgi:hypothetical protein
MNFSSLTLCFIRHFTSLEPLSKFLTINVPYLLFIWGGRYEVVLRGGISITRGILGGGGGGGPKNRDFFGP